MIEKLTYTELVGLGAKYNLADGHARQSLAPSQIELIDYLPAIYRAASTQAQAEIEERFRYTFFKQQNQTYKLFPSPHLLYSASIAIHVAARLLSEKSLTVGLITPTFDNIYDLLRAQNIRLVPVDEVNALDPEIWEYHNLDALFLVLPNNPTGWNVDSGQLQTLARNAASRQLLLVIDFSFRYFDPNSPDAYRILSDAQCNFIAIEDTGKFLACADVKVGIIASDGSIASEIAGIVEDILLNVSPFSVELLTQLMTRDDRAAAHNLIRLNRTRLATAAERLNVHVHSSLETMSVAWISGKRGYQMGELVERWRERDVVALPGSPFFWHNHSHGANYARIALARPPIIFDEAMTALVGNGNGNGLNENAASSMQGFEKP